MKKVITNLILLALLIPIKCFCQPSLSYVNNNYIHIKYGCITGDNQYYIDMPVLRVTGLENNQLYEFVTDPTTIFDYVEYVPYPFDFTPFNGNWLWEHPTQTFDTILYYFEGYYNSWVIGAHEVLRFGIRRATFPKTGDIKGVDVSIVDPGMVISGSKLFCSNPVTFTLLYMPTTYTSATWQIKQGSVIKASGSGITALANNLSNGPGEVIFTIHFTCQLNNITYQKQFHFGPYSSSDYPITGPSSASCRQYVYYSIPDLAGVTSINWVWPSGWTYVSGQNTRYLALRTGTSSGTVMVGVNNSCGQSGSYASKYTSVSGCYSLVLSPNPASEILNVKIIKEQSIYNDSINIVTQDYLINDKPNTYIIKITDRTGFIFSSFKEYSDNFSIPLQSLKDGNYIITVQFNENQLSSPFIKLSN